jgi:prefoldin subunit 5
MEHEAQSHLPGSWRERQAIRRFEEERTGLLDELEEVLLASKGDVPGARMAFENLAKEAGLDLELPSISGRVHGLFDLQISLNDMEMDVDPVAARRDRAIRLLLRRVEEIDDVARSTLERMEQQIEALERVVETVIRRNDGKFTSLEHSLMIRFLERRGWDVNHPEVRPRLIAAAGVLAVEMGYISEAEMPTLPGQIALDPERVSDVVETLNDVLESFGKRPARTVDELEQMGEEVDEIESARRTLDSADLILDRLRQLGEEGN